MKRTFNLFFARPENIFDWQLEVPEDWDEWSEDERLMFLDDKVDQHSMRHLEVEEYDES